MKLDFLFFDIHFLEKAFLDIEGPFKADLLIELNVIEAIEAVA
ncbi:hypothetical protein [Ulvibacter litoralis]|uniref:Uncharacterized protein n=1 Tax=Ulvibacter litoralis TaxID=227084 RepID=A0A1G7HBX3_9FLAO|nr:hypothetical protein [Ulvibacter litoralis]GHC57227.1 hypothetical protein GCM10008083_22180 [Ulvibacter litoralis]SDE97967.1 hypothetical protein SAMN05421855_1042 [Ulvibacter litoralis]